MQIVKDYRMLRRTSQFVETGAQNQRSVDHERYADEKPNRNRTGAFHVYHQKMMFKATNTIPTTVAQNAGR